MPHQIRRPEFRAVEAETREKMAAENKQLRSLIIEVIKSAEGDIRRTPSPSEILAESGWYKRAAIAVNICPQCGDQPTHQTPDGTFWDGNAHFWKHPTVSGHG